MKKLLLTVALVAVASVSFGQGTIQFVNGTLTKVKLAGATSTVDVPTTTAINYGIFWGTASDNLALVPTLGASSTTAAGIIAGGASATFAIPGAAELSTVWLQVKGWDASFGSDWATAKTGGTWFGETAVRQVTLAGALGPGTVIWQTATGTNPNRFTPLTLTPVPEPSTFALAGLGAAALLIFRRRK